MHPGIKLRHIRLFLQVADLGSLTAAGRAAGLSQPAVSKSLSELELMLGAALVQRQGRRLVLTPQGEAFRRHAREGVAALNAAARAVRPDAGQEVLRVGLLPTVSTRFFPELTAQFLAEEPGTRLAIETGAQPYLLQKLRDRQIDLLIGRMPVAAEMAGLDFEHLYDEPIVAVLKTGHPLARAPLAEILARVPVVLPTRDAVIRRTVDDYLAALGLADLRPAVETSTLALGRGIVLASDAVWFISQGVVEAELALGQMTQLPLGAAYLSGAVGMTRPAAGQMPAALTRLIRLARAAAAARREGRPASR